MEAIKLRENYQQALLLLSNLQQHPATHERALSKLFLLVRLCYTIRKTATSLPDKDSSSIWQQDLECLLQSSLFMPLRPSTSNSIEQDSTGPVAIPPKSKTSLRRAATLHSELTTATAQFLQSADQSGEQFWDGCVRLLYCGAESYDQIEKEKDTLVAQLSAEKEHCARLEQTLQDQYQKFETSVTESIELRSKVITQQQIIEPLENNYRETHRRLDVTIKEKHALAAERDKLTEERSRNLQILERQANAIQQLMEQCEAHAKEKNEALESVKSTTEDNHTLRVNLGQHGQVIENLINLNAEMMDAANFYSVQLEEKLLENQQEETRASLVDGEQLEENADKALEDPDIEIKPIMPSQSQDEQAPPELSTTDNRSKPYSGSSVPETKSKPSTGPSPTKTVSGPSPDLFSRIKGKELSPDASNNMSTTDQDPSNSHHVNGEEPSNRCEPKEKNIAWTSDMLISQRGSASSENLQGLEEKVIYSHGSSSVDSLKDLEHRANTVPSGSHSVFRKFGGIGGRLQAVGGKAKGFLDFVAGADLAPEESE